LDDETGPVTRSIGVDTNLGAIPKKTNPIKRSYSFSEYTFQEAFIVPKIMREIDLTEFDMATLKWIDVQRRCYEKGLSLENVAQLRRYYTELRRQAVRMSRIREEDIDDMILF
jgi:hypothetical protein